MVNTDDGPSAKCDSFIEYDIYFVNGSFETSWEVSIAPDIQDKFEKIMGKRYTLVRK